MAVLPFARWMPISTNFTRGKMSLCPNGIAIHVTDGVRGQLPTLEGVKATFNVKKALVSAHFCVAKDGTIAQYVDTGDVAFAVGGDSKGDDDTSWISVENIALPGQLLTDEQLSGVARILNWFNANWGVPLTLADSRSGYGLGYHSMFHRGHPFCPGVAVINQRSEVIRLAEEMGAS